MRSRCALVTGATGFIGNYLVRELRRLNWRVFCLTRQSLNSEDPGIDCVSGDLTQPGTLERVWRQVKGVDTVFHLAAQLPTDDATEIDDVLFYETNAVATMKLLKASIDAGVASFVYASSLTLIGKPRVLPITEDHPVSNFHPYFISKFCGELYCETVRRTENRRVSSLRITSPYGAGMSERSVLSRFVHLAMGSKDIELFGSGNRRQNFVHVEDVIRAILLAADTQSPGVFNVGGACSISMKDLAALVLRLVPGREHALRNNGLPDPQDDYFWDVDLSRAERFLAYHPEVSLEEGLSHYIAFSRKNIPVSKWWIENHENSASCRYPC
jgi:UDP-glucose 4-epimerase